MIASASTLIASPYSARAWTPNQPPLPATHAAVRCAWRALEVGAGHAPAPMCLRERDDVLSGLVAQPANPDRRIETA